MCMPYPIKEFVLCNEQCEILNSKLSLNFLFFFRAKFILLDLSNNENTSDDNINNKEDDEYKDVKDVFGNDGSKDGIINGDDGQRT